MKVQLEHARFCWAAEEENARRPDTRKALIASVPAGAAAFVAIGVGDLSTLMGFIWSPGASPLLTWISMALAGFCLARSFALSMNVRPSGAARPNLATSCLHQSREENIQTLGRVDGHAATAVAWVLVYEAFAALHRRNTDERRRLRLALEWLVPGLLFSGFTVFCYYLPGSTT